MARYTTSGTKLTVGALNTELEKIAVSQQDFLSRIGQAPNQMEGNLDMNSNRILNLPAPVAATDVVRLQDLTDPSTTIEFDAIYASGFGVLSDGGDYTTEMQAFFNAGNENTTFIIDSTHYALSNALLINKGFKEVIHYPDSVVDWLGAGLLSTTALALFTINLDANGARTNETVTTTTSSAVLLGGNVFPMASVAGLATGKVIRIDKHICRVVRIDGLNVITDRTLPIPSMVSGSEVSVLLKPNIGSVFQGPSLIKFAADNVTQVYGFGVIAALCYNVTVKQVYGLHNASRLAELFYCADSLLEDVYQYEPTDVSGGGQSYAGRISNGNDNVARKIRSYKGRHCVDITFSHRNRVMDSVDYQGIEASFLTHFNGCRYNKFINCNMYECLFGVYLSNDAGDFENEWTDSFSYNSRAIYRPDVYSYFRRLKIVTDVTTRDVVVPRASALPSTLNIYDSHFDLAGKCVNVDSDFTFNMYGGSYVNSRIDGLFRGLPTATPGAPSTNGSAKFNFYGVQFPNINAGQGRSNINASLLFKDCVISYSTQPFGEDCGSQRYVNCDITCTEATPTYLVTVGSGNNCELVDCTLRDVQLPFRYFAGFPATGTITFGGNKLLGTSTYDVPNLLSNMNWTTSGYISIPLSRSGNGSPANGTEVYIDTANVLEPIKRYRQSGVWVDFYSGATQKTFINAVTQTFTRQAVNTYINRFGASSETYTLNASTFIEGDMVYVSKLFNQVGTLSITTTSGAIFLPDISQAATQTLESVGTVAFLFDGTNWLARAA
jgi:hypothetical protein